MTTFVRRIPAEFQDLYTAFDEPSPPRPSFPPVLAISPQMIPEPTIRTGYMERELGAVTADEHSRHEKPESFVEVSGDAPGQRKDMPYCFAPYDGLRGLGMQDIVEFGELGEDQMLQAAVMPPLPQLKILPAPTPSPLPAPPLLRGRAVGAGSESSEDDKEKGIPLPALALLAVGALLLIRKMG